MRTFRWPQLRTLRWPGAATRSLAFLLEELPLRKALIQHLGEKTGTDLSAVASFLPEVVHTGIGRTDLEGWDDRRQPLLVVEGKFGAWLTRDQVQAYWSYLAGNLEPGARGAIVLLVPSYRVPEAEHTVRDLADEMAADPSEASVTACVVSWDDVLGVLDGASQELSGQEQDDVIGDLRQLQALCEVMAAAGIPPLGLVATGQGLEGRKEDLRRLVDEVTSSYSGASRKGPLGTESWPEFEYYRRYIPGGLPDCWCSVGLVSGDAVRGAPFWLRYNPAWTPDFPTVRQRILASRFGGDARGEGGDVWLPLPVSGDRSGAGIIEELTLRIDAIRAVAAGSEILSAG